MKSKHFLIILFVMWAFTVCTMIALMMIGNPIVLALMFGIGVGVLLGIYVQTFGKEENKNDSQN